MVSTVNSTRRDDVAMAAATLVRAVASATPGDRVSYLTPARELPEFRFGSRADVRHWLVFAANGRLVGAVERLLVETSTWKVRYAVVALDHHAADDERPNMGGSVLVPIGALRRIADCRGLALKELSAQMLVNAPRVPARAVTRADERATLAVYGCDDADALARAMYQHPRFDEDDALTH